MIVIPDPPVLCLAKWQLSRDFNLLMLNWRSRTSRYGMLFVVFVVVVVVIVVVSSSISSSSRSSKRSSSSSSKE